MGDARFKRWDIGDVAVTRILETEPHRLEWEHLYSDGSAEMLGRHDWLVPDFVSRDGKILLGMQAFVVQSRGRTVLVDTCVGNGRERDIPACHMLQTAFMEDLAAAGFPPERIDLVLCTHLHFDHVGWNTKRIDGRWVPAFPTSRYLFARREWEHWRDLHGVHGEEWPTHMVDSVLPVIEAGLADFVADDHRITDEVWLEPTPGHTPGHVSLHIASGGRHAVITGDMIHSPIEMAEPDLHKHACTDPDKSVRTRRAFLEKYQDRKALVIGTHFSDPTAGWVLRDGPRWRFAAD